MDTRPPGMFQKVGRCKSLVRSDIIKVIIDKISDKNIWVKYV